MRKTFAEELYKQMLINQDIWLVVGDVGYGLMDRIRQDFPSRFINAGASEQAMMGIAVGLSLKGKIPFVYTITTFLLRRPYETINIYLNHENIPVKLIGSGRDYDYQHDGWSHHCPDAKSLLKQFPNIISFWPEKKEELPKVLEEVINNNKPSFISLRR